jgi:hypothetical protein
MNITPLPTSVVNPRGVRDAYIRFFSTEFERPFTHTVTVAFNSSVQPGKVQRFPQRLHRYVDRKLFGTRFNVIPRCARTIFEPFFEGGLYHPHWHCLISVPQDRWESFEKLWPGNRGNAFVASFVAGATYDMKRITNLPGAIDYAVKLARSNPSVYSG